MTIWLFFFLLIFNCWYVLHTLNCEFCESWNCPWLFFFFLPPSLTIQSPQMVFIELSSEFSINPCVLRSHDPNGRNTANWEFIPGTLASALFSYSFIYLYLLWQVWISSNHSRVQEMSHFFVSLKFNQRQPSTCWIAGKSNLSFESLPLLTTPWGLYKSLRLLTSFERLGKGPFVWILYQSHPRSCGL